MQTFQGIRNLVSVVVDNRVRVAVSGPKDPIAIALKERFTYPNPSYKTWKTFRMGAPPPKTIETWSTEERGRVVTVPRGAYSSVVEVVNSNDSTISTLFATADVDYRIPPLKQDLWPHQVRLIESFADDVMDPNPMVNGLWRAPQGSGKTQAVLALATWLQQRTLIIVSTSSLFQQWQQRVRRELGIEPGTIQGAKRDVRAITIGMAQTLAKCAADFADTFGLVCLDEAQLAAATTFQDTIDVFRARYRLGVTGDERRADSKEFLTYDMFGPVSCEIDRQSIVRSGEIVDVEVRIVPTDFRADWYVRLGADDSSDERQRVRAARDKVHHRQQLLAELTKDEDRNQLVVNTALDATVRPLTDLPIVQRRQFIVLSDRVEQCRVLELMLTARRIPAGLFIGGADYKQTFELTLAGMRDGSVTAGVGTYQAIGVGFEANRELGIGICASPCVFNPKSRMQFMQYRNRLARSAPGKTGGVMYYLWDRHVYGMNPVRLLCKWNTSVKVQTPDGWVEGKRFLKDA